MVEKQASSEIAQSRPVDESRARFLEAWRKSGYADMSTWREISWDLWQAAERDTRERCAQIAESQIINWSNNLCDESRAETATVKPYSAGPITFGGESKKYAAECLASCAVAVAERIRGKE